MQRRLRRWVVVALLVLAAAVALVAAHAPYLPLIHGTTAGEVERLAAWLEVRPGMRIVDFGAGEGEFSVAPAHVRRALRAAFYDARFSEDPPHGPDPGSNW